MTGGRDRTLPTYYYDCWRFTWDGVSPIGPGNWVQLNPDISGSVAIVNSASVVHKTELFVIGSDFVGTQLALKTSDGVSWTILPTLPFQTSSASCWSDGTDIYLAYGGPVAVLSIKSSPDGISWATRAPTLPFLFYATRAGALSFNDYILLVGGATLGSQGHGWISLLPPVWDRGAYGVSKSSYWEPFYQGSPVVFNGRIWLFGNGYLDGSPFWGTQDVVSFVPDAVPVLTPDGFYLYEAP